MLFELIIIFISLILTFYFSGTETAFITANRVRIELWRRQKKRAGEIIVKFLRTPERFIYTTLVGNNIANVAFATYATIYLNAYMDEKVAWFLITAVTIMWGEIIPKTLFRSLADWIILKVAPLLEVFYYVFRPMIILVSWISGLILNFFGHPNSEIKRFFSKKDIEILLRESKNSVNLKADQSEFLEKILQFREMQVKEVMVPRPEIVSLEETSSIENFIKLTEESGFTRVPLFKENIDHITGIVYLKDIFLEPKSLQEIKREILFVPETKKSLELLSEFRKSNTSIAVVFNEYGGTAGLVTSEDLIEELVGEIEDEFDETTQLIRKSGDNVYSVNARIELEELQSQIGLELPEGEYETLAGFVLNYLGHIPKRNEEFEIESAKFTISKATKRKIETVRITLQAREAI